MQTPCLALVAVLGVGCYFFRKSNVRKRQQRNIRTAEKVLRLLSGFSGESAPGRTLGYLRRIDPFVFEELLLTAFERKGYRVKRNERYTGDGGVDGRVYRNGELYLIQAKRYKSYVSARHLENFLRLVENTKEAKGGYFIHTGRTGKETCRLYRGSAIQIISGERLIDLILQRDDHRSKKQHPLSSNI